MPIRPPRSLLVAGFLIASAGMTACGGDPEQRPAAPPPPVEALPARAGSLPLEERMNGLVKARNQVAVRPEISGRVTAVMVDSGQAVERGQVLVRLDADVTGDQLRQAEASARLAAAAAKESRAKVAEIEARVVRSRSLAAQALISHLDLETQEAQLAAAQASAEQAEARVDEARATVEERRTASAKTVVRSPIAGRVGQRRAEIGMMVDRDTLLFRVGDLEQMIVEVPLTDSMLDYLEVGQTVLVTPSGDQQPLRAELSRISPFLEDGSFSTIGEIDVDNAAGHLRPGMFVGVDVLYGESQRATLVPASALWDDPRTGVVGIYVLPNLEPPGPELSEKAFDVEWRQVEVLAEGRSTIGVRGVDEGEWVVTIGQHLLSSDGPGSARVRPVEWPQVVALQSLQREDLLDSFLDKQRRLASAQGARIPSSEEFLKAAETSAASAAGVPGDS